MAEHEMAEKGEVDAGEGSQVLASPDAPPTYDSIFGKIRAERERTPQHGKFLQNCCGILTNTVGFTIMLAVSLAVPIAMMVIGSLNLTSCPIERFIPIWLVVSGATSALMQLISIIRKYCKKDDGEDEAGNSEKGGSGILGCFSFAWFIAGNVWVFRIHGRVTTVDSTASDYCDGVTYYFAFWSIITVYILMATFCWCACCIAACIGKKK